MNKTEDQVFQTGFPIPQDAATQQKIYKNLSDISDLLTMIAAKRDTIKEIISDMSKEHKIPKKQLNKLARAFHKQNFQTVMEEQQEFEVLYKTIVKN